MAFDLLIDHSIKTETQYEEGGRTTNMGGMGKEDQFNLLLGEDLLQGISTYFRKSVQKT